MFNRNVIDNERFTIEKECSTFLLFPPIEQEFEGAKRYKP